MPIALTVAALALGMAADKLRQCGVRSQSILAVIAFVFITMQTALILHGPIPSALIWCLIAGTGAATVISYSILAECFPTEITSQANSALNTLHIGGACIIQGGFGMVVGHWTADGGHYPAMAYKVAIGINVLIQILALLWFIIPRRVGAKSPPTPAVTRIVQTR
jgi:MFS family permease